MDKSKSVNLKQLIEDPEPLILPYGPCTLHAVMAERFGFRLSLFPAPGRSATCWAAPM